MLLVLMDGNSEIPFFLCVCVFFQGAEMRVASSLRLHMNDREIGNKKGSKTFPGPLLQKAFSILKCF